MLRDVHFEHWGVPPSFTPFLNESYAQYALPGLYNSIMNLFMQQQHAALYNQRLRMCI